MKDQVSQKEQPIVPEAIIVAVYLDKYIQDT